MQITVQEDGNLVLIPREGRERFLFGQACDMEKKFEKMELYYKGIREEKGEDAYRTETSGSRDRSYAEKTDEIQKARRTFGSARRDEIL